MYRFTLHKPCSVEPVDGKHGFGARIAIIEISAILKRYFFIFGAMNYKKRAMNFVEIPFYIVIMPYKQFDGKKTWVFRAMQLVVRIIGEFQD